MMKKMTGLTLVEMLAALVVAGILFAVGTPAIRGMFTSNRIATHLNQLSTAIQYARSEAINRVVPVAIGAPTGNWADGWDVWIETVTEDGLLDTAPPEPIVRKGSGAASTLTLTGTTTSLVYMPDGTIRIPDGGGGLTTPGGTTSFTLCHSGQMPRILNLSVTGRPELNTGTTACP